MYLENQLRCIYMTKRNECITQTHIIQQCYCCHSMSSMHHLRNVLINLWKLFKGDIFKTFTLRHQLPVTIMA
jgi:hypothetical protein